MRRTRTPRPARAALIAAAPALLLAIPVAPPAAAEGWDAARFDAPAKVESATDGSGKQVTCTVYPDFVIRESDTDSPDPEDAALLPVRGGAPPTCRAAPGPDARRLATGSQRFLGRRGGFLVFEAASTNGTVPFAVLDAASGRTLFEDVTLDGGVDAFTVEGGSLRLGFRRGVQASCSIPRQGAACWARVAREEPLPGPVASLPAPACAAAYRAGKAPRDAPSIVAFPVRLAWTGTLTVEAAGPVRCLPTP